MPRQYKLMSSDGHLEVPPERWIHRVPQKHRDRAPHTVHLPDGGDALMIEGQPLLHIEPAEVERFRAYEDLVLPLLARHGGNQRSLA